MSVNPIKGKFVRLQNDEMLKARNQADTAEVEILKVNTGDQVELASLPVFDDGLDVSQVATEKYVDAEIATVDGRIDSHVGGLAENHPADDITVSPVGALGSSNVQAALEEIQGDASQGISDAATAQSDASTALTNIGNHISDTEDAHDASAISFNNIASELAATNVQSALDEVEGRIDALEVGGGDTKEVKVSSGDTTPGFLFDKIEGAADKISINVFGTGLDETLIIDIGSDVFDKSSDTTTQITEGDKLFFTDARARSAAVEDTIADGEINIAPSQNAVHDALALKVDLAGSVMTGPLTLNADPSAPLHAATKQYVDAVAEGLHVHAPARLFANFDLDGNYNDGPDPLNPGVGAYLDISGSPIAGIDGISSFNVGDRIIVAFQNASSIDPENGVYYIAASGDINGSGDITKLTRAVDFNTPVEMAGGDFIFVQEGTLYGDTGWVMTETVVTVGTTPVKFLQFSGAGEFTAGAALELDGSQFNVLFDGATIDIDGLNQLYIPDSGVGSDQIAANAVTSVQIDASVAGDAMEKDMMSGKLDVRTDGATIGINPSNNLYIPLLGVGTGELANDSVTSDKIADNAVTSVQIDSSVAGDAMEKDMMSGKLDVRTDGATIGINPSNNLYIPLLGVGTGELANDSVTSDKIADNAVTSVQIDASVAGDAMEKDMMSGKLDVRTDGATIGINPSNNLYIPLLGVGTGELANDSVTSDKIADNAVTSVQIDASVAGDAMEKDMMSGKLDVRTDGATIGINPSNNLYIPLLGVGTGELANDSVTSDKIADNAVTSVQIDASVAGEGLEKDSISGKLDIQKEFNLVSDISVSSSGLSIANRWYKESYAVPSALTTGATFTLAFEPEPNSMRAFVDRLAIHESADSGVDGLDYGIVGDEVTFYNALVTSGQQQLSSGDTVFFMYQKKAS
jgi:ethanolamine utilization protein EutQ (cupin superfamily)